MNNNQRFTVNSILLVDDEPSICFSLQAYLEDAGYQIMIAHNGQEALDYISVSEPDLVILDLYMPAMDGHELLKRLSVSHPDIPKLILSGVGDISVAMQTIHEGAWDFIAKPITDLSSLRHKISMINDKANLLLENSLYQKNLERLVDEKTADNQRLSQEIIETQKAIIGKLGDVIETRSNETGNHVRRVAQISRMLALKYGMDPQEAELLCMASPTHDLGKVGIPDRILMKRGKLTAEEFEEIKTHTRIGNDMLKNSQQPILRAAAIVALQHHEYWDGSGYPQGLRGEDIHIFGRITCLVDVYDALRQKRLYKDAWQQAEALDFIREKSGLMFDPQLVDLFFQSIPEIEEIIRKIGQEEIAR
jgi:putative two-component system response regulator